MRPTSADLTVGHDQPPVGHLGRLMLQRRGLSLKHERAQWRWSLRSIALETLSTFRGQRAVQVEKYEDEERRPVEDPPAGGRESAPREPRDDDAGDPAEPGKPRGVRPLPDVAGADGGRSLGPWRRRRCTLASDAIAYSKARILHGCPFLPRRRVAFSLRKWFVHVACKLDGHGRPPAVDRMNAPGTGRVGSGPIPPRWGVLDGHASTCVRAAAGCSSRTVHERAMDSSPCGGARSREPTS